jgi:hypothetical protein
MSQSNLPNKAAKITSRLAGKECDPDILALEFKKRFNR